LATITEADYLHFNHFITGGASIGSVCE